MNEPWYERIKGNEMRSLFKTRKQHAFNNFRQTTSTPDSIKLGVSDGESSRDGSLCDLDKNTCSKRQKMKGFGLLEGGSNSEDRDIPTPRETKNTKKGPSVANKDLLQHF